MSDETYYTVLGVPRSASPAQIKATYRELMRQVHPDALPSASNYWKKIAEERTKDINEAYTVLSDPKKRRLYDQQLDSYHQSQSTQAQYGNGAQAQQHAGTSGAAHQTQPSPRRTYPGSYTSKQSPQPSQSAISGVNKPLWACWCLFWGILWSAGLYSQTSLGEEALTFGMAFVSFGLAALTYWPQVRALLSRLGIKRSREQLFWASGVLCLVLFSILGIGEINRSLDKPGMQASVVPVPNTPRKNSSPVSVNQKSGASGPQVRDNERPTNARNSRPQQSSSQVPSRERQGGKLQPARIGESQQTTGSEGGTTVLDASDVEFVSPNAPKTRAFGNATVTEFHNEKVSSRPDLSRLSGPEQQSIEAACSSAKYNDGPAAYNRCLERQLAQLSTAPRRPDLSRLSGPEQQSIEAACSSAKYNDGPAAYNRCLTNQLRSLQTAR